MGSDPPYEILKTEASISGPAALESLPHDTTKNRQSHSRLCLFFRFMGSDPMNFF